MRSANQALLLVCVAIIVLSHGAVRAQDSGTPQFAYGPPKGWVYKPDAETLEILKQKALKEAAAAQSVQDPSQQAAGMALSNQGSVPTTSAASKRLSKRSAHVNAQPVYLQTRTNAVGGRRLFL